eukprot:g23564.t1
MHKLSACDVVLASTLSATASAAVLSGILATTAGGGGGAVSLTLWGAAHSTAKDVSDLIPELVRQLTQPLEQTSSLLRKVTVGAKPGEGKLTNQWVNRAFIKLYLQGLVDQNRIKSYRWNKLNRTELEGLKSYLQGKSGAKVAVNSVIMLEGYLNWNTFSFWREGNILSPQEWRHMVVLPQQGLFQDPNPLKHHDIAEKKFWLPILPEHEGKNSSGQVELKKQSDLDPKASLTPYWLHKVLMGFTLSVERKQAEPVFTIICEYCTTYHDMYRYVQ